MSIHLNPVLDRELRERSRSKRTIVVLFVYLALLAGLVQLVYAARRATATSDPFATNQLSGAVTGRLLFDSLLFAVILLSFLVVPALTAAGIAGERDRQTLVPLQVTLLRPRSILIGKLLASLAFVTLLLIALAPLLGASLILGGVTVSAIAKGLGMTLLIAVMFGSTSLLASTLTRRVQGAFVLSLVMVFLLVAGTFIVYGMQQVFIRRNDFGGSTGRDNRAALVLNPLVATADALRDNGSFASGVVSPFRPLQTLVQPRQSVQQNFEQPAVFPGQGGVQAPAVPHDTVPIWLRSVLAYLAITVVSLALATRRLRTPAETGDR